MSLCNTCLQPYQLMVGPGEVPLIKQIASEDGTTCPCPRSCSGHINLVGDPTITAMAEDRRLREPLTLTGKQLYQAVQGLGLPDEIPKEVDVIDSVFRANMVVKVDLEQHQGKIYLHEIHFENGMVIHLASGHKGAQILRVDKGAANGK